MLLGQVEGHGDVGLTRRLLRGLHAAGHRRRHGHAGLWKFTEKNQQGMTSPCSDGAVFFCFVFFFSSTVTFSYSGFCRWIVNQRRVTSEQAVGACRGIKWRFTILSCVIARAETAESGGKQPLLQSAELMIKFACIILDFCSCLVFYSRSFSRSVHSSGQMGNACAGINF